MITVSHHEKRLRQIPCVVSHRTPVTLHHCHGGSIKDLGWHVGVGQKQNPFLQIPLYEAFHTGRSGVDRIGVLTWEKIYGTQHAMLMEVDALLDYPLSLFECARSWEETHRSRGRFIGIE